ncbi:MAG: mechanosensitive ion channel family protein [Thermoplasmatota archaeon]
MRIAAALLLVGLLAVAPLAAAQAGGSGNATRERLVLGQWSNPLPEPLDGPFGAFLLNILAWLAIASLARLFIGPVLQLLAQRTKTTLDDKVIDILGTPLFVILLFVGIRVSLRAFLLPTAIGRSLDVAGTILFIVVIAYVLFRAWNEVALVSARRLAQRTQSTIDNRALPLLEKLGGVLIVLFAVIASLQAFGVGFSWLLAGGAFASIVIGLAAQDTLSNFFSGVHLLVDQPFREGDEIQLEDGPVCTVRRVGLRSTHLYNRQTHDLIIVPNNMLATLLVTNMTRPDRKQRLTVEVGVAYRSDPDKVKRLLTEAALAHPLVLREPGNEPQVRLTGFGDSALTFALIFWVADHAHRFVVPSDLRIAALRRFAEAGIEIPFPHRVVVSATEPTVAAATATAAATADAPAKGAGPASSR